LALFNQFHDTFSTPDILVNWSQQPSSIECCIARQGAC